MARSGDRRRTVTGLALRRDWAAAPMLRLTPPSLAMGGSPPVAASAGRGGLLPLRLTVVEAMGGSPTCDCWSRLSSSEPGVMVLMDRQARCSGKGPWAPHN
jgi:hypothetical protein